MNRQIIFFNMNGSGLGHMNRCLAYAQQLKGLATPSFFSLASAAEIIEGFGFESEYFVSHYWSGARSYAWNSELALRFGMMLERVRPDVVVFDGTWPFQGFLSAIKSYGNSYGTYPKLVWSNRGLMKEDVQSVPVPESLFDLVIVPGELGSTFSKEVLEGSRKIMVPPVTLIEDTEMLPRELARQELGIALDQPAVLISLGPGNLKDVGAIGSSLVNEFSRYGFQSYWAKAPISIRDPDLPTGVIPLTLYPLAKYLKAFDLFVGAAGYNTCCELVQANIPSLLVPNTLVSDDQSRRASLVSQYIPTVISPCETDQERSAAVKAILAMLGFIDSNSPDSSDPLASSGSLRPQDFGRSGAWLKCPMNGAQIAAQEILKLLD